MNSSRIVFTFFLLAGIPLWAQQTMLSGSITEPDSVTPMPFVYVISKQSGNGTMTDNEGRFTLISDLSDTLVCSFVGYLKQRFPVTDLHYDKSGKVRIIMTPLPVDLSEVSVTSFRIKPYERQYMQNIIEKSQVKLLDYSQSPITALYMKYSKEGRQIQKLARIFEEIFIEEQVQKKLNREILAQLTGDDSIDYEAFRKYCYYMDNDYILRHDGAELYSMVMDCYRRWKREMKPHR